MTTGFGCIAGGDPRGRLAQHGAQLALQLADARLPRVVGDDEPQHVGVDRDVGRAAGRSVPPGAATGSRARWPPSRRSCSRRTGSLPSGRAAVPGSCPPRWRWRGTAPGTGRAPRRGSDPGRRGSARGRAPRAAPPTDRRASPPPACRPRRAGSPGSSCPRPAGRARAGRAGRRCRCGDARGSRPRRARRPGTCGRTSGRWRGRSTRRSTSCRSPEGRSGSGWRPTGDRR